ncbi:MAG: alpha/beta hydrolase [Burkholderiaceae bacterium]|nr:alpha/beta hydrolase [Burkholderiaceae bacterium]
MADDAEILIEGGGRDAIVLIHGWPDTHRLWDAQVEALRGAYRCARFTLPGFDPRDATRAYALEEVLDLIGHAVDRAGAGAPVTLLLHDWGCFFGYQFALRHPERVHRIVAVDVGDAGSRRNLAELSLRAKALVLAHQLWLAAAWRIGGGLGDRMARWMARTARAPAAPARITAQMGYPYYVQWILRGYASARLFKPACPLLFLYGSRKPFMFHSTSWADEVAAQPGSRVIAFDCGHWVMTERPEAFNQAVLQWLAAGDATVL